MKSAIRIAPATQLNNSGTSENSRATRSISSMPSSASTKRTSAPAERASVRVINTKLGSMRAAAAALILPTISSASTTCLLSMCPHFFGRT